MLQITIKLATYVTITINRTTSSLAYNQIIKTMLLKSSRSSVWCLQDKEQRLRDGQNKYPREPFMSTEISTQVEARSNWQILTLEVSKIHSTVSVLHFFAFKSYQEQISISITHSRSLKHQIYRNSQTWITQKNTFPTLFNQLKILLMNQECLSPPHLRQRTLNISKSFGERQNWSNWTSLSEQQLIPKSVIKVKQNKT